MSGFKTFKQRMNAYDILMGDTIAIAREMATTIVNSIWDDSKLPNGAIVHLSVKDAEFITNVARWGDEFVVNHQTKDKTSDGVGMMSTHETGKGKEFCINRLTKKLCMFLPAMVKGKGIDVTLVSVEQLPVMKPIAFLSTEEIFKAVDDERD